MKLTSTVKLLSILMMSLLVLTSCLDNDDDKKDDPTPDPDPAPEISCTLSKISYSFDAGEQRVAYNEKGNVSSITTISADGTASVNNYQYDANDRVVRSESRVNEVLQGYSSFTYTNGLLSKTESFDAAGQSKSYTIYSYDAKGNATEVTNYAGSNVSKGVVTYTPEGNIATRQVYSNGKLTTIFTYSNYDDKKYYQTALKGLPLSGVSANKNNYGSLSVQYYNTQGELTETREFTYRYKYNEQGYPIEETETYKGEDYIYYLNYNCK